ncbi:MAG: transcriptional regulator [Spirochaetaceae bacterium]|nr:MAG: transcriptional regulator [Spirochaetaceae bacterium]
MSSIVDHEAREDFNRARIHEMLQRILHSLSPQNQELLSLNEVKQVVRPRGETYRGMQTVEISQIVGSEGRYRDFSKSFLPRHDNLKHRWISVDKAHLQDIILPPVRLFEIGGLYFVRDGNHRVSVAKAQGVGAIDAEVTSLASRITLDPHMTREDLTRAIIDYEKRTFYEQTRFRKLVPDYDLNFTATGRYDEVLQHIHGHKYFINQGIGEEIPFEKALVSWYLNVFRPVVDTIEAERIMSRFPGRTHADLYMWIVKRWHILKDRFGADYPVSEATRQISLRYGQTFRQRLQSLFGLRRTQRRIGPDNEP